MIQLERRQQLVIIILLGLILFGGGYRLAQVRERAAVEAGPVLETAGKDKTKDFMIHVTGAVTKPGVYQVPQGSRVIDAINRAAPETEADLDSLKLASPVTDGQSIFVPSKLATDQSGQVVQGSPVAGAGKSGFSTPLVPRAAGSPATTELININTADQGQLDTLPGIGPALAQRIISYRDINGSFKSAEDLKNVSGIGDKNFEKLKDKITVR